MKRLKDRILLLRRRAAELGRLLTSAVRNTPGPNQLSRGQDRWNEWLAFEFAATHTMLTESLFVYASMWPHDIEWLDGEKRRTVVLGDELKNLVLQHYGWEKMASRLNTLWELTANPDGADDLFECLWQWREFIAAGLYANDDYVNVGQMVKWPWDDGTGELDERFGTGEGILLIGKLRSYLSNEWLYGWAQDENGESLNRRYRPLISLAKTGVGDIVMSLWKGLELNLNGLDLAPQIMENVKAAIDRLAEILAQDGLDGLFDILEEGGALFDRLPGSSGAYIAVIPGRGDSGCRRVLFAFAKSANARTQFGTTEIMHRVREYLIRCGTQTPLVFLFAPIDGLGKVLEESTGDLEAYLSSRALKAFVPVAIFRDRMTAINWR